MNWQGSSCRRARGWLQARQRVVTQTTLRIPLAAGYHQDCGDMGRGTCAAASGNAHGHCLGQSYAARITVPIVSFLPKRRRIVRGLM